MRCPYPKQGYFVETHIMFDAAKIFRCVNISGDQGVTHIVYELIHDDIFNQPLNRLQELDRSKTFFKFQTEEHNFPLNDIRLKYKDVTMGRSIAVTKDKEDIHFFHTYIEALVFLYKQMLISSDYVDNVVMLNGLDKEYFSNYMEKYKDIHPEEFI